MAINVSMTLLLNLSAVMLIDLSSLVLSLSKVVKDILLIAIGTRKLSTLEKGTRLTLTPVILHESITLTQVLGYSVALAGLLAFKLYA